MTNAARKIFDTDVLPLFEATRADWLKRARLTARYLARKHGSVNINQVRAECPPPDGIDPRVLGAVFTKAEFECVGFINSDRRTCHGRPIREFKLREAT